MTINFEQIRQDIGLLSYCEQRGIALRRTGNCWTGRCPIHQERNGNSFVVWSDQRWSCFGKCSRGGDVIELERALGGGTVREAVERLAGPLGALIMPSAEQTSRMSAVKTWRWSEQLRFGSEAELQRVAHDRSINVNACQLAQARGLLRFLDTREGAAWIIKDKTGENAVARLIGGQFWANGAKAKTLPECRAKRPIGIVESMEFPNIAIVEGGPDLLAGFHFAIECGTEDVVAPVCMTSANSEFAPGDLERLRGKAIRLFPHADEKGCASGARWFRQLRTVSPHVDYRSPRGIIRRNGAQAKDLNDLVDLAYDSWEPVRWELDLIMVFGKEQACILR
jgi:CHC2 zinc finger